MKYLVVGLNYFPELTGIGKYTGEMSAWLAAHGETVKVICAPPYYPEWKVGRGYRSGLYKSESIDGVEVLRCPVWVPAKVSGARRILHLLSFGLSSSLPVLWTAFRRKPDVILVIEPPLVCAPAVLLAGWLGAAKTWIHVQDFEVDAAFDLGIIRGERMKSIILGMERWLLGYFNRVSTISSKMMEKLESKGVRQERSLYFPNWVELDKIYPQVGVSPFREEWGLAAVEAVVLYSGNMGEKQGLEVLIEVAGLLRDESRVAFVFCGDGAARQRLVEAAEELTNVHFKPLQAKERLNDLLNLADIHALPQRGDVADLVLPSKLTNMMASGRPVIATALPGTQVEALVNGCGIVVPPEDARGYARAVISLLEDPDERQFLGKQARLYAEQNWSKDAILEGVFKHSGWTPSRTGGIDLSN